MGGASPKTVNFRGANVDPTTADALTELAAISGSIYVEPIPGYGSYRNNVASGGTDTGGGHCDLNLEGRSDTDARRLETLARSLGFVAYFRPRVNPYTGKAYGWQRHLHLIRRDCTDLSAAARAQVGEYDAGRDGLAVPHKDTGSRAYVGVTWSKYRASQIKPPTPAPAIEEDDMAMTPAERAAFITDIRDAILNADVPNHDANGDGKPDGSAAFRSYGVMANFRAADLQKQVASLRTELAGISAAMGALAKAQGADAAQIAALVDKAVRDRLAQVRFDVTDTPTA